MSSIFKAYDIRGVYPSEINERTVFYIGRACVELFHPELVLIGQDARPHSPALYDFLIKSLGENTTVISIGLCTTPLFYFASEKLKADLGIMITASHNPAEYNGIKLVRNGVLPVGGDEIQQIKKLAEKNMRISSSIHEARAETPKKIAVKDLFEEYKQKVLTFADLKRELKVVVDTGNGMCGLTVPRIFESLALKASYIYKEVDLTYPNHEANPLKKETLRDLQDEVVKQKADIGIAFDGDGDRAGFVDEAGRVVDMDLAGALLAADALKKHPNSKVIYDVRSSRTVQEVVKENFGKPVKSKVGHYFIKRLMRQIDSQFATEVSGHYYFKELGYTDSAVVAALKVLNILSAQQKKFSEIMQPFYRYFKTDEINFNVKNADEIGTIIENIKREYYDAEHDETDGLSIIYPDWWSNIRGSNTEQVLRVNVEARSRKVMEEKIKEIGGIITSNSG